MEETLPEKIGEGEARKISGVWTYLPTWTHLLSIHIPTTDPKWKMYWTEKYLSGLLFSSTPSGSFPFSCLLISAARAAAISAADLTVAARA
jgi:hypothetical protein